MGIIKFYPQGYAEIENIVLKAVGDTEFEVVLGKGILNFIDRRGVLDVYYRVKGKESMLDLLKFTATDSYPSCFDNAQEVYHLNLKGYFDGKCGGNS